MEEIRHVVLQYTPEHKFGIEIADNDHGDVWVTSVNTAQARDAGVEEGDIILKVAGTNIEGRGAVEVQRATALSSSAVGCEFVMRPGKPLAVRKKEHYNATVIQAHCRGHRARVRLRRQQYDEQRRKVESSGDFDVQCQFGVIKDSHDVVLERLETIEYRIQRATTDLSQTRRAASARGRVPIAAGRSGSSTYLDSRTGRWSRPNTVLADSRSSDSSARALEHRAEQERRPGDFHAGQLMSAWDQSQATAARRKGLPASNQADVSGHVAVVGLSPKQSAAAVASPKRSLSKSLAATMESSHGDGLWVGRRTFI